MNPRLLPTQSDSRLTDLARAGSEPAFEAIVARYRRSLVRCCARVVGEGDAEEAVQDALLKAHTALLGGDPVRRLAPWLHVVAHNTAVSYLRVRSSRPQPADADYEGWAVVDRSAEYRQELDEVLAAVQSLPARQRDAIVMRELEGRSYEEIAARLGSSHGAVRQLLHRARSSVRDRVAALLPLEPLARWALTGVGGADAAGGGSLSGACALGAKACAALILPATVALVASAPATRTRTMSAKHARPSAMTTYARQPSAGTRPLTTVTVARETGSAARQAPASSSHDASRLTASPRESPIRAASDQSQSPRPRPRQSPRTAQGSQPARAPGGYPGSISSMAPKPSSGPSTKKISIVMSGST